jgi:hypothetical protein
MGCRCMDNFVCEVCGVSSLLWNSSEMVLCTVVLYGVTSCGPVVLMSGTAAKRTGCEFLFLDLRFGSSERENVWPSPCLRIAELCHGCKEPQTCYKQPRTAHCHQGLPLQPVLQTKREVGKSSSCWKLEDLMGLVLLE